MKDKRLRYTLMAVVCVAIGAMAGIASGSAAGTHQKAHASASKTPAPGTNGQGPGPGGPGMGGPGMGGPPIHSVSVVPNKEGTGFDTLTIDSGTVQSVSGQQLSITEGTKSLTYKTVTLTIPAAASIQRDGKTAQLSELQSGDHVTVSENSDGTTMIFAADSSFKPSGNPGGPGMGGPPPPAASTQSESSGG
jgi:hypothetical protein